MAACEHAAGEIRKVVVINTVFNFVFVVENLMFITCFLISQNVLGNTVFIGGGRKGQRMTYTALPNKETSGFRPRQQIHHTHIPGLSHLDIYA